MKNPLPSTIGRAVRLGNAFAIFLALVQIPAQFSTLFPTLPIAQAEEIGIGDDSARRVARQKKNDDPLSFVAQPPEIDPVKVADIDAAVSRGIQFILKNQNRDGSWGLPRNTKGLNIYAPGTAHNGYRAGTTALVLESLLRTERFLQEKPDAAQELKALLPQISQAADRCEAWMLTKMLELKRSSPDVLYNNWGHAYGMSAFRLMFERKFPPERFSEQELSERREKIRDAVRYQLRMLENCECLAGGWCYYDGIYDQQFSSKRPNNSTIGFVTATVLVGMADGQACGVDVPQDVVKRALASLERQRLPNGSFAYSEYLVRFPNEINKPPASLGRSQACHLALALWGDTQYASQQTFEDWLNRLVARIGWLDVGKKRPVPHESWFKVAGYFYYYAHYYASRVLERLENPETQKKFANHLSAILLEAQDKNGTWWDYPLYDYHLYYGTGMAVSSLLRNREYLAPNAASESPRPSKD